MKRMNQRKLNNIANFCGYCVANMAIGVLLLTLGFAFAVMFCNIFDFDSDCEFGNYKIPFNV